MTPGLGTWGRVSPAPKLDPAPCTAWTELLGAATSLGSPPSAGVQRKVNFSWQPSLAGLLETNQAHLGRLKSTRGTRPREVSGLALRVSPVID